MSWRPYEEILYGSINEALYAADLWAVYTGRAPERYQDPIKFFERTYFTQPLKDLLRSVARRLCGDREVNPVWLILTGLGGGKTHSLIAVYHLAKYGKKLDILAKEEIDVSCVEPAVVVVFDGAQLDRKKIEQEAGSPMIWAYLFKKLYDETGDEEFRKALEDYKDIPPGADKLRELLGRVEDRGRPALILIDETYNYLKTLNDREREVTELFFQHLSKALLQLARSFAIITFLDTEETQRLAKKLIQLVQRVSHSTTMVTPRDLPSVIRRSLIKEFFNAEEAANQLHEKCQNNISAFENCPSKEELSEYFPIHPETVRTLSALAERVEGFQATRDVLRILAWALRYAHQQGDNFVTLGSIPIDEEDAVRATIFRNPDLRRAVEQDLADLKGYEATIQGGECGKVVRRIYRALAVASSAIGYVDENKLATYVYTPNLQISPLVIPTCTENMMGKITHLHQFSSQDGKKRYAIKTKAYWRTILQRRSEEISAENLDRLYEKLRRELQALRPKIMHYLMPDLKKIMPDLKIYIWEVPPDEPGPILMLADPRWERPLEWLETTNDGNARRMKGAVLALLPDQGAVRKALKILADIEAAEYIKKSADEYGLEEEDVKSIEDFIKKQTNELKACVAKEIYNQIAYFAGNKKITQSIELDFTDTDKARDSLNRLVNLLKSDGKLADRIDPNIVARLIRSYYENTKELPTFKRLVEMLSGELLEYPILPGAPTKLKELVKQGDFYVVRGGYKLENIDVISEEDQIATKDLEIGAKPPQPPSQPAVAEAVAPQQQQPTRSKSLEGRFTVGDLAKNLGNFTNVRMHLSAKAAENARELERAFSFLRLFIEKVAPQASKIELNVTVKEDVTTQLDFKTRRIEAAKSITQAIQPAISTMAREGKTELNYSLIYEGAAKTLVEALDTPMMRDRFRELQFYVELEELV